MKERGDGSQKEFQVSHCYVCSVVDILLLSVPVSELPVYIQKMKDRGDSFQKEFQVSHCYVCL